MHQPAMFFMWLCTLCGSCWGCKDVRCPFGVRPFTSSPGEKKSQKKKSENNCSILHGFLWALGKQAKGLVWKQREDESWRLPKSPHLPNLIVCIKIGVATYYPPSPYLLLHLGLFFECWLNKAMAQLEKMKEKKRMKRVAFCIEIFCAAHPPPYSFPG